MTYCIPLAEISIGILGFTGVVLALQHQTKKWNLKEKILFETLVSTSLTALLGTFLPELISTLVESDILIWQYANMSFLLLHLTNLIIAGIKGKNNTIKPDVIDYINLATGAIGLTCNFLAFLDIIHPLELVFIMGILQQLYVAMGNFLRLVSRTHV